MEVIKDTIWKFMQDLDAKKNSNPAPDWDIILKKVFTKKQIGHIKFNYFKKGILNITVDSSAWLYQLSMQKEEVAAKIKKEFAGMQNLYFHLGEIK